MKILLVLVVLLASPLTRAFCEEPSSFEKLMLEQSQRAFSVHVKVRFADAEGEPALLSEVNTALRAIPGVVVDSFESENTELILILHGFRYGQGLYACWVTTARPAKGDLEVAGNNKLARSMPILQYDAIQGCLAKAWKDQPNAYFLDEVEWRFGGDTSENVLKKCVKTVDAQVIESFRISHQMMRNVDRDSYERAKASRLSSKRP